MGKRFPCCRLFRKHNANVVHELYIHSLRVKTYLGQGVDTIGHLQRITGGHFSSAIDFIKKVAFFIRITMFVMVIVHNN